MDPWQSFLRWPKPKHLKQWADAREANTGPAVLCGLKIELLKLATGAEDCVGSLSMLLTAQRRTLLFDRN